MYRILNRILITTIKASTTTSDNATFASTFILLNPSSWSSTKSLLPLRQSCTTHVEQAAPRIVEENYIQDQSTFKTRGVWAWLRTPLRNPQGRSLHSSGLWATVP